jgi:hypothetical protein
VVISHAFQELPELAKVYAVAGTSFIFEYLHPAYLALFSHVLQERYYSGGVLARGHFAISLF